MKNLYRSYYKGKISFWNTFRTEWNSIKSDKAVVSTFLSVAFIILVVYTYIYSNQIIKEVLTVNGVRFSFEDGSWGLIRASSNKPSLVVVTESPTSNERKKKIFTFIDNLLKKTGKIGDYDQKI